MYNFLAASMISHDLMGQTFDATEIISWILLRLIIKAQFLSPAEFKQIILKQTSNPPWEI